MFRYCVYAKLIEPLKKYDKQEYLRLYLEIMQKYSDYLDPPESIYEYYSENEIMYILKCIETETYDCDFDSKCNVASVILNRVDNDLFPIDPIGVVTATNQFAYGRDNITESTKLALDYVWYIEDTTNGCIGFNSFSEYKNEWNGWEYSFTDNVGHHFYKLK